MKAASTEARRGRYLIDPHSQLAVALQIAVGLLVVGGLDAVALFVLSDVELQGMRSFSSVLPLILLVHGTCILLGALFISWVVVKLTHRYVGPAHVMQRALEGMREGDYGRRLGLRDNDYLIGLAGSLDALRKEIARRDVDHARTLHQLRRGLDADDVNSVRDSLRALGAALPAIPQRRIGDTERRSA